MQYLSAQPTSHEPFSAVAELKDFVLIIGAENQLNMLSRIAIIFSRRRISIDKLTVGTYAEKGTSEFQVSVRVTEETIDKIMLQIRKQIGVVSATYYLVAVETQ